MSPRTETTAPLEVLDPKYSARFTADESGFAVAFRGTISSPQPSEVLFPFVEAVHAQLIARDATEVSVDFLDLEFCNSSGFKSFIYWVEQIRAMPDEKRYRLRFISNGERKWQRTSLLALSCYGVEHVKIETWGNRGALRT
jgi:hypothetical protein